MTLNMFLQQLMNAIMLGSLYGLIAIGYTMVYGILRLINFAHGDIFMLGAYFVFFTTITFMPAWIACGIILLALLVFYFSFVSKRDNKLRLCFYAAFLFLSCLGCYYKVISPTEFTPPWVLAVFFSIFITSAIGIAVDRVAYRPLRDAPRISALISAIGVSFLIENLCVVIFSGLPRQVLQPKSLILPWVINMENFGGSGVLRIMPLAILVPCIAVLLVFGLLWIINKTKPGLAMRAISHDIETARLMGVSVNKIIALTFGLGSALAAAAGTMWALRYPQIQPYMGILPGLKAFIAAVIGGIGSIHGAMLGGLILGIIEIMVVAFFPHLSGYRDAFAFILLIIILVWRPTGLFGGKSEEKI